MIMRTSLLRRALGTITPTIGSGRIYCFCSFGFTQVDRCTLARETENIRHRVVATAEMMRMICWYVYPPT